MDKLNNKQILIPAQYKTVNQNWFQTSQHVSPYLNIRHLTSAIYFQEKFDIRLLIHWQIQILLTGVKEY